MAIKYIVDTFSSERDVNGNRYHYSWIISTATGHRLAVRNVGGDDNVRIALWNLLNLDGSQVFATQHHLPKREWKRREKFATDGEYYPVYWEHELTAADVRRLNRKRDVYGESRAS